MTLVETTKLELLLSDGDAREMCLREIVEERLTTTPPPVLEGYIVATYFLSLRTLTLQEAAEEISYHASSGDRHPPAGSLLEECTAKVVGVDEFDCSKRLGLLHMAFPLKMMSQPDGHLTSCDMLHTMAGAIIFDVYENQDARLVSLNIPEKVIQTFPGPAHGMRGIRQLTGFPSAQPAFGTILKPTAGITPNEVGQLVEEVARCPLFLFVKEDENLYPNLDYSPAAERTRQAVDAIERAQDERGGLGLIFAPHISGAPHEILETVHAVLDAGASGVMFSETFAGGTVRMVREATKNLSTPPIIYGHNAGIGVKTRAIWREIIDLLARLDGIDLRQTSPVRPGTPFLRPYGAEWEASEEILTRRLSGIHPTAIVRAGSLDQGNICINLADAEKRGRRENVMFVSGSAINSIKNSAGKTDPRIGVEAMLQAIEVHDSNELRDVPMEDHVAALMAIAEHKQLKALRESLRQRYPGKTV
ncbi:MAG: RuBisCO large subunit C-terminal-like domain-containing protein [Candidatus Poribacteria bacterium]|nr:RuBisCO large subunit C-terminal-like domain-containing protein [Candidatus Poribacteria bacterium]